MISDGIILIAVIFRRIYSTGKAFYDKYKKPFTILSALWMFCDIGLDMACVKNYYDKCIEVKKYLYLNRIPPIKSSYCMLTSDLRGVCIVPTGGKSFAS